MSAARIASSRPSPENERIDPVSTTRRMPRDSLAFARDSHLLGVRTWCPPPGEARSVGDSRDLRQVSVSTLQC